MALLPNNRDELRKRWESGERFDFYFFYGHKAPVSGVDASCLSQWFQRVFQIDGVDYPTAEHWMMAEKARLFDDDVMLAEILSSDGPKEAKAFGRKVRGFDNDVWNDRRVEIVKRGNLAKFGQHDDLKSFLLSTSTIDTLDQYGAVAESNHSFQIDKSPENDGSATKDRLRIYPDPSDTEQLGDAQADQTSGNSTVILVEAAGRDTIWGIGLGKSNPKSLDPFLWRGRNLLGFVLTAVREELRGR